jgi:hypothetical protein
MHSQVVSGQDQARRQVALERQAAKAHQAEVADGSRTDTVRTAFTSARRVIESLRPRIVRHAPVR